MKDRTRIRWSFTIVGLVALSIAVARLGYQRAATVIAVLALLLAIVLVLAAVRALWRMT